MIMTIETTHLPMPLGLCDGAPRSKREVQEISFRPARIKDCPELSALVNSAYRGESSKKGWTTEADLIGGQRTDPDTLAAMISDESSVILLALAENRLCGCVFLSRRDERAYLGMLTVRPDQQATGLGKLILATAEYWVSAHWGLFLIEMTVIQKRGELLAWYERRGYRRTGRTEPFPYGDEKFGLPKVQDLEFVVLEKALARVF